MEVERRELRARADERRHRGVRIRQRVRVGPARAGQAVGAPEEQDAGGRRGEGRDEGGPAELQEESPPAGASNRRLASRDTRDARQLVVGPAERDAPGQDRREHPRSAERRARCNSVELVLDDQGDAAQNRAEDRAQQQCRFAREPEQREQQRAASRAGKQHAADRLELLHGLGGRAQARRAERTADGDGGLDAGGDDRTGKDAGDPVEEIERQERQAGASPAQERHGHESGGERRAHQRAVPRSRFRHSREAVGCSVSVAGMVCLRVSDAI